MKYYFASFNRVELLQFFRTNLLLFFSALDLVCFVESILFLIESESSSVDETRLAEVKLKALVTLDSHEVMSTVAHVFLLQGFHIFRLSIDFKTALFCSFYNNFYFLPSPEQ